MVSHLFVADNIKTAEKKKKLHLKSAKGPYVDEPRKNLDEYKEKEYGFYRANSRSKA